MTMPHEYLRSIRGTPPLLEAVVADSRFPMDLRTWAATALELYPTEDALAAELDAELLQADPARVNAWGDALMYARRVLEALMRSRVPEHLRNHAVWAERHFPVAWQLPKSPLVEEPQRQWRVTFMGLL